MKCWIYSFLFTHIHSIPYQFVYCSSLCKLLFTYLCLLYYLSRPDVPAGRSQYFVLVRGPQRTCSPDRRNHGDFPRYASLLSYVVFVCCQCYFVPVHLKWFLLRCLLSLMSLRCETLNFLIFNMQIPLFAGNGGLGRKESVTFRLDSELGRRIQLFCDLLRSTNNTKQGSCVLWNFHFIFLTVITISWPFFYFYRRFEGSVGGTGAEQSRAQQIQRPVDRRQQSRPDELRGLLV